VGFEAKGCFVKMFEFLGGRRATLPYLPIFSTCLFSFRLNSSLGLRFKLKQISGQEGLLCARSDWTW
jgi:hypothetical protein